MISSAKKKENAIFVRRDLFLKSKKIDVGEELKNWIDLNEFYGNGGREKLLCLLEQNNKFCF